MGEVAFSTILCTGKLKLDKIRYLTHSQSESRVDLKALGYLVFLLLSSRFLVGASQERIITFSEMRSRRKSQHSRKIFSTISPVELATAQP